MAAKRTYNNPTYAERKASGRPIVSFVLPPEAIQELARIAERVKLSRSAVVALAISELGKRYK